MDENTCNKVFFICPNTSKAINCSVAGDTEDNGSQ
nr:MAG TPA: hypothetical protein [Caudoviricetes sp.]